MKFLIAFGIVLIIAGSWALTDEQKAKAEGYAKDCMQSEGVTVEEVKKVKSEDFSNASDKVKCFANCVLEKAGLVKDGKLQEQATVILLSLSSNEEKAKKVVDLCKDIKGDNNCDTGFKISECYAKNRAILTA